MTVTYLMLARLPADGAAAFDAYESAALPLLAEHGGHLERRLRTLDDRLEAHLVSFASEEGLAAYRADPRRTAAAPLLDSSGAVVELLAVRDVRH
jgi:antibiotic biosynthesis monooxygenase (ABM) superfamily enzyme